MPSGSVLAAAAVVVMAWYAGTGIIHGTKFVVHKAKCGIERIVGKHCPPHDPKPQS